MAVISGGTLECRPFYQETAICGGRNFLSHKVGGVSSLRISVWECSSSSHNNGSLHLDNENAGEKLTKITEDVIFPSHIDARSGATSWWLPLFGWSQADQEPWADDDINESITKGKALDKSSEDGVKEMKEVPAKRSEILRGRLTREKAKLLRKNLRDTSTFRDAMYHSAIASRLASPDSEGHG